MQSWGYPTLRPISAIYGGSALYNGCNATGRLISQEIHYRHLKSLMGSKLLKDVFPAYCWLLDYYQCHYLYSYGSGMSPCWCPVNKTY